MNAQHKRLGLALLGLVSTLAMTGCGPSYDHTDFTARPSKLGGTVTREQVVVPEGMIVTAHVVSYNDDNKVMSVGFRSRDDATLTVQSVISDHDFAFVGLKQGVTDVELRADNDLVLVITATVVPQTAAP